MRGRRDHLLPQGYLKGFTDPTNPTQLSVYDIQRQRWFETGTERVACIRGFYDYAHDCEPDQTADQAFREFEVKFPNVRNELASTKFSNWRSHLEFLLAYAQMLRARSELFREEELVEIRKRKMFRVKEVFNDLVTGKTSITYEDLTEDQSGREALFRNMTITNMRAEIAKRAALFSELHWCLRFTNDVSNPVITSDNPIYCVGQAQTIEAALKDERTFLFFPLSWQACLIGIPTKFDLDIDVLQPDFARTLHSHYLSAECRFAYAPNRLCL